MATTNEDKDKRIVELQAHNNDLFNKLEEFEERYNNQLDVSRSLFCLLRKLLNNKKQEFSQIKNFLGQNFALKFSSLKRIDILQVWI